MANVIVIDFGGVLVRADRCEALRVWESRLGLCESGLADALFSNEISWNAIRGRIDTRTALYRLAKQFNVTSADMVKLWNDFWSNQMLSERLLDSARELRSSNKVGICTNMWSDARDIIAGRFGLLDLVDYVVISAEEGVAKPSREIFERVQALTGCRWSELVVVDDQKTTTDEVSRLGLRSILFETEEQAVRDLQVLGLN